MVRPAMVDNPSNPGSSLSPVPSPTTGVVKVKLLTEDEQRVHRSVIAVDKIEPCTVGVIPHEDGVHFYMLRDKGYDR